MLYVIDQNYFRSAELQELIQNEPQSKIVIPDVALVEMCKSEQWESTMTRSLKGLSAFRGRVFHAMSVGDGLNAELTSGKSIEQNLLPREYRDFLRETILNVEHGSGRALENLRNKMVSAQSKISDEELNHERNQEGLKRRIGIVENALAGERLKDLRAGRISPADKLSYIRTIAFDLCLTFLINHGYSKNKATIFLKKQPLILRFYYISVRHAVDWAASGGIDSLPAHKATNDLLDQEYVLIASFFDGLLTREPRVQDADADLRKLLRD